DPSPGPRVRCAHRPVRCAEERRAEPHTRPGGHRLDRRHTVDDQARGDLIHMSTSTERSATLNHVIDYRVQVYGDPVETFVNIAKVWSGILGTEVNPTDV